MKQEPTVYRAPVATQPVTGTITVPGSKSLTNRALVLAGLAEGPSTVVGALLSRDTTLMADAFTAMGTNVTIDTSSNVPVISVTPGALRGAEVHCGLAGTVMRFLPPVAALADGDVHVDGDEQARVRPMATMLDALRELGVDVTGNRLPFTVHGTGEAAGGRVTIDASASSQFVSGLLLAGARYQQGITVTHVGGALPSQPHIDMTVDMLRQAGVTVHTRGTSWTVEPGPISARTWYIEPDLSNAGPFMAAAVVTGGTVDIAQWPVATTQPGAQLIDIFCAMGARAVFIDADGGEHPVSTAADIAAAVHHSPNTDQPAAPGVLRITGPASRSDLVGITLDMRDIGELVPTVAAVAALATTRSIISGIGHLRGHETDRLQAITNEIARLGGDAHATHDTLTINPATLTPAVLHTYADHRMATFAAIIGLVVDGVDILNVETTAKTLPNFTELWQGLTQ